MTSPVTVDDIDAATARLQGVVETSPLQFNPRLSQLLGRQVWLKREDLQTVRSYKLRGAYNLMAQLTAAEQAAGVVCASAGNHAQGVAFASAALGIDARIYLPRTTPRQKRERIKRVSIEATKERGAEHVDDKRVSIEATKERGAEPVEVRIHGGGRVELIVTGDTYDDAAAAALADRDATGATLVPPFDDARTVAGQGTVAAEILRQLPGVDTVVVPVGGGGLLAGTLVCAAAAGVRVVGAEPAGAASLTAAYAEGGPTTLAELDPFVDGAAVRRVGAVPFAVLDALGRPDVVEVMPGAICTEMLELYQHEGIVAEPAGALAVAALGQLAPAPGSTVVAVVSGGNNDVSRYGEVVERSLVHLGLKHYFLVEFPQEPGALRRFLDEVLGPDDDITLFEYVKRNNRETGPALVGIEIGGAGQLPALLERMRHSRMRVERVEPGSPAYAFLT